MYECGTCGYQTKRSYNFNLHNSRKTPCKPKLIVADEKNNLNSKGKPELNGKDLNVSLSFDVNGKGLCNNICQECTKVFSCKSSLTKHSKICKGIKTIHCPTCLKVFSCKQSKYEHRKNVKCHPPIHKPESVQEENERLKKENKQKDDEIEALRSRPITTNTGNTINNGNVINNTTTNINVVQYNNYDKPYTDHITNKVMKCIYETSQRDPALILNETVRRIYKNDKHPENHVIKIGEKTALSRVYKDGKEIWLPMDGVIQSVMSSTGEFCADRIRDCHEEGVIIGDRARYVWQLMEVLGTDDREDDCLNRSSYVQSIKSAFL